jgi:D-alanyl-D-alanine carboxypeptidase
MRPTFPPGTPGRAHYSDTNYQLLGRIVENAGGVSLVQGLQTRILDPLALKRTFMHSPETLERYPEAATMRYGRQELSVPRFMASFWADGGMVSTATEGLTFLRAFVTGELFAASHLARMTAVWRPIFRPLEYGIGIMRLRLPRYYSPLKPVPTAIGHSGASGTVLFHFPDLDLYVSGTVNQVKHRSLSYRLMIKLVMPLT